MVRYFTSDAALHPVLRTIHTALLLLILKIPATKTATYLGFDSPIRLR